MKNLGNINLTTEPTEIAVNGFKHVKFTVGSTDALVMVIKQNSKKEDGDYIVFPANDTYIIKADGDKLIYYLYAKTATGTTTLTNITAFNENIKSLIKAGDLAAIAATTEKPWQALGTLRRLKITETAGNVTATLVCPAGKKWILICGVQAITLDATVANRNVWCYVKEAVTATTMHVTHYSSTQVAGTNSTLNFSGVLNNGIVLAAGDYFFLGITGGVAGDSWTSVISVIEVDA